MFRVGSYFWIVADDLVISYFGVGVLDNAFVVVGDLVMILVCSGGFSFTDTGLGTLVYGIRVHVHRSGVRTICRKSSLFISSSCMLMLINLRIVVLDSGRNASLPNSFQSSTGKIVCEVSGSIYMVGVRSVGPVENPT